MPKLLAHPRVQTAVADQCMYGLITHTDDGQWLPAKKPTMFATSSPQMAHRLSLRCDKSHQHQPLLGGRAADAAFYPMVLITEILRGMRDTQDAADAISDPAVVGDVPGQDSQHVNLLHDVSLGVSATLKQEDIMSATPSRTTVFKFADGKHKNLNLSEHFKDSYRDEYTDELIPSAWAQAAIEEERSYVNDKVWTGVALEQALSDSEAKVVGTRWVISNKGDSNSHDVRARLVAQETAHHTDISLYAATPPLESKRVLFSQ